MAFDGQRLVGPGILARDARSLSRYSPSPIPESSRVTTSDVCSYRCRGIGVGNFNRPAIMLRPLRGWMECVSSALPARELAPDYHSAPIGST